MINRSRNKRNRNNQEGQDRIDKVLVARRFFLTEPKEPSSARGKSECKKTLSSYGALIQENV